MSTLNEKASQILDSGRANLLIGYTSGKFGSARPIFIRKSDPANGLVFDETCAKNLVTYILKPEVKKFGRIAIFVNIPAMKTILQLASENQISDGQYLLLTVKDGNVIELSTFSEIEEFLKLNPIKPKPEALNKLNELKAMPLEQRYAYWTEQFADCVKCYACRAVCPLCYCSQCTVECNQPQWIPVAAHALGNCEWHIMRAMHLAGRCIACGDCVRACPVEIPLGFITMNLNQEFAAQFGQRPGLSATAEYALNSFKVEDKEIFIR